jgi:transcription elongation GreA/GreB family factor
MDLEGRTQQHIVNERAPIAQALLGLTLGEEGVFQTPNGKRVIRVLKVQRPERVV